jgi:hypothetical protein
MRLRPALDGGSTGWPNPLVINRVYSEKMDIFMVRHSSMANAGTNAGQIPVSTDQCHPKKAASKIYRRRSSGTKLGCGAMGQMPIGQPKYGQ